MPTAIIPGHIIKQDDAVQMPIAIVPEGGGLKGKPIQICNATLIAASPDLYAALEAICEAYGCECVEPTAHCPMCIGRAALAEACGMKGGALWLAFSPTPSR